MPCSTPVHNVMHLYRSMQLRGLRDTRATLHTS